MIRGIAISQEGVDVTRALDAQKVLDTRWKYLETYKEVEVSVENLAAGANKTVPLFEHGLGFVPFFDCYDITAGAYIAPISYSGGPNIKDWAITAGLVSDKQKVFFFGFNSTNYTGHKLLITIYNLDAAKEFQAPNVRAGINQVGRRSRYGVKVTQRADNDSMRDPELSHFTLNTNGKALAIQKIGTVAADTNTGFNAVVNHGLGNLPIFLSAFMRLDKSLISALNPQFIPVLTTADRNILTFRGAQAALIANLAYIVFKELAEESV
jgi:hypothetical protein